MRTTRREFLKDSALTGLVLWIELPKSAGADSPIAFEPSAYISVTPDNLVRLWITRSEMGQGVRTTLPMMILEELEADWSQIRLEQAMPGGRFTGIRLRTSGSGSTVGTYQALRKAGATAREMLIAAAAEQWKVPPSECRAEKGTITHSSTGRKRTYGQLALAAARRAVPDSPPLKEAKEFKVIGTRVKRRDGQDIVTGRARFGFDV